MIIMILLPGHLSYLPQCRSPLTLVTKLSPTASELKIFIIFFTIIRMIIIMVNMVVAITTPQYPGES